MDPELEVVLILKDPECLHGLPVRWRCFREFFNDKLLIWTHIIVSSLGPQTHLIAPSPVLQGLAEISIFSNWQNPHIVSLTNRLRDVVLCRAEGKLLELPLFSKLLNPKQFCVAREITEISDIIRDLKKCTAGDSCHIDFEFSNLTSTKDRWVLENGNGLWALLNLIRWQLQLQLLYQMLALHVLKWEFSKDYQVSQRGPTW